MSNFDNTAINNYVNAADELGRLTEAGASEGELLVAKMYMCVALADLIAPNETPEVHANLVLLFMRSDNPQIYAEMPQLEDVEETLPSTPLADEEEMDPVELQNLQNGFSAWQAGEIDDYGNEIQDEMPALD